MYLTGVKLFRPFVTCYHSGGRFGSATVITGRRFRLEVIFLIQLQLSIRLFFVGSTLRQITGVR